MGATNGVPVGIQGRNLFALEGCCNAAEQTIGESLLQPFKRPAHHRAGRFVADAVTVRVNVDYWRGLFTGVARSRWMSLGPTTF